jgi:hypothetical protein
MIATDANYVQSTAQSITFPLQKNLCGIGIAPRASNASTFALFWPSSMKIKQTGKSGILIHA